MLLDAEPHRIFPRFQQLQLQVLSTRFADPWGPTKTHIQKPSRQEKVLECRHVKLKCRLCVIVQFRWYLVGQTITIDQCEHSCLSSFQSCEFFDSNFQNKCSMNTLLYLSSLTSSTYALGIFVIFRQGLISLQCNLILN